jgi:hypothetical protein
MAATAPAVDISTSVAALIAEGKYADAATIGESLALSHHATPLTPAFFALLAAAHLASGSFAAARLAVVRGVSEVGDRQIDYVGRLLEARKEGRYADALGAARSAPADIANVFRDVLVGELAATVAATYTGASLAIVSELSGVPPADLAPVVARVGPSFGVRASADGALARVGATAAVARSKAAEIASVQLVTEAALMCAKPIDRAWN